MGVQIAPLLDHALIIDPNQLCMGRIVSPKAFLAGPTHPAEPKSLSATPIYTAQHTERIIQKQNDAIVFEKDRSLQWIAQVDAGERTEAVESMGLLQLSPVIADLQTVGSKQHPDVSQAIPLSPSDIAYIKPVLRF